MHARTLEHLSLPCPLPNNQALLCKPSHVLPAHGEPQARPREPVKMAKPSVLDGAGTGSKPQSITKLLLEATLANQKYRAIQEELRAKDALLAALQAKTVELTSVRYAHQCAT